MRSEINELSLKDFRSYESADLRLGGRTAYVFGANGAGKTNLLEAISLLSPGRGLRGASLADMGRRPSPAEAPTPWAFSARLTVENRDLLVGSGSDGAASGRRIVRIDGETAPSAALSRWVRPIWLGPAQDRLFLDSAADRRRFFDRLVFVDNPDHARCVAAYDRALRERIRLLTEGGADLDWLSAIEARMAQAGSLVAGARARTSLALQSEIDRRSDKGFPKAGLALTGQWESMAAGGAPAEALEAGISAVLVAGRARDAAAGRTLEGPHRCDLQVTHLEKGEKAADCSTGEQKALILNLVLAQAARLSSAKSEPNPILLFDEVAAHLDPARRAALFDEIDALSLQAFLTGTDEALFDSLRGRAVGVHIIASALTITED